MARSVLSWCLVFWVGLVCPSLCVFAAAAANEAAPQHRCSCPHDSKREAPSAPSESPRDPCFCSGDAVQLSKGNSLPEIEPPAFEASIAKPLNLIALRSRCLAIETFRISLSPGEDLVLPLLI